MASQSTVSFPVNPSDGSKRRELYSKQRMDKNAIIAAALANVPTLITVLIGILINNSRISDLNVRVSETNARLTNFEGKMDTRFDMLLGKVVDIDNRLTRMEAQRR